MEMVELLLKGGALAVLTAGAAIDLQTRRIPNWLTFGGALAGLAASVAVYQAEGIRWSLGGWLVGVLLLAIPFALRGTGAGDVKLLAAAGAWAGPMFAIYTLCLGAIAGGAVALGLLVAHRQLGVVLRPVGSFVRHFIALALGLFSPKALALATGSTLSRDQTTIQRTAHRFAYGPALAIGGLVAAFIR